MFDLLLKNAKIVDGTGSPSYYGDVGVRAGRIAAIGRFPEREKEEIDLSGKTLAPGFIDVHTHSDFVLFRDPVMLSKLTQGVTTQFMGQCGMSAAPATPEHVEELRTYSGFIMAGTEVDWRWSGFASWLDRVEELPLAGNVAPCVGHGTLRIAAMGFEDRRATDAEMALMKELLREAVDAGCFGFTSGLVYPPGVYAPNEELLELCRVVAGTGVVYLTHPRSESGGIVECVLDTLDIGRKTGVPVQLSHHKAMGAANRGLVNRTLQLVDEARAEGIDVTLDQYPYTRGSTSIRASLPPWVQEGGIAETRRRLLDPETRDKAARDIERSLDPEIPCDWESMLRHCGGPDGALVLYCPRTPQWEGRTLRQVGEAMGLSPVEAAFEIILANDGSDLACYDNMFEEDVRAVMRHPSTMIGSDSIPAAAGAKAHPRSFGTHPRVLGRYVREEKVLSLEEAVRKMTGMPAARFGLERKGVLREGMDADLVVFDERTIRDRATFEDPLRLSEGVEYAFVAGQKVLDHGEATGLAPGRVLRKGTAS